MPGYDPNFLGTHLPLPTFTAELEAELVEDGELFDYPNYSVIQNGHLDKRSPAIVLLNINQTKIRPAGDKGWKTDREIGADNQLGGKYYDHNPWDKGHMARRETAAWGDTDDIADHRARETFYYSNCALQHKNLNRDEWAQVEDWVIDMEIAKDGLVSSMSGPIYGNYDRSVKPAGKTLALIPAGFFKVVCFINKVSGELDVRAFVLYQDEEAIANQSGRSRYNNQRYQVTISEIEKLTGILFDDRIRQANPLFASPENALDSLSIRHFPENIEIGRQEDLVDAATPRERVMDDDVAVYIAAALVDPKGTDRDKEWIAILNMETVSVDVSGWAVADNKGAKLNIDTVITDPSRRILTPGQSLVLNGIYPSLQLNNRGDVIKLYNASGERVDWANYAEHMVQPGRVLSFLSPRDTLK